MGDEEVVFSNPMGDDDDDMVSTKKKKQKGKKGKPAAAEKLKESNPMWDGDSVSRDGEVGSSCPGDTANPLNALTTPKGRNTTLSQMWRVCMTTRILCLAFIHPKVISASPQKGSAFATRQWNTQGTCSVALGCRILRRDRATAPLQPIENCRAPSLRWTSATRSSPMKIPRSLVRRCCRSPVSPLPP